MNLRDWYRYSEEGAIAAIDSYYSGKTLYICRHDGYIAAVTDDGRQFKYGITSINQSLIQVRPITENDDAK